MNLRYVRLLEGNDRVEIIEAIELSKRRYERGDLYTSIHVPPRYGKSSIIWGTALELHSATSMPCIMTAPWSDIVEQMKDVERIRRFYKAYGIAEDVPFTAKRRSEALQTHTWWTTVDGVPTLLTCTTGLIQNKSSQQIFLDGISDMHQRFGKRVPVVVDECHLYKKLGEWGQFIERIVESGGYVVLLTGTAVPGLPGFVQKEGEWNDIIQKITRKRVIDGEIKYIQETYEGKKRSIEDIEAHLTVTWRRAWNIKALAKVNAVFIDIEVFDDEGGTSLGLLSELPKAELNGRLRSIEETPEMIVRKAHAGVDRLLQLRSRKKTQAAQMLVITGSDHDGTGSNKHAKDYRKAIEEALFANGRDPTRFRIAIATGKDNEGNPDSDAATKVKAFRQGDSDILIVKGMGIVGMDAPACKVLIYASTTREGPQVAQSFTRPLTIWDGCKDCPADLILSQDVLMAEAYDRIVKAQGGERHTETDVELVDEREVPPPPEKVTWAFKGAVISGYGDEHGGVVIGNFETELRIIKAKYDTSGLNDRQIIENYTRGGFPLSETDRQQDAKEAEEKAASGIRDLDEGSDTIEGDFGKRAKAIVNKYVTYSPISPLHWREKLAELQAAAKRLCGVPKYIKVSKIDDVALLKRLIEALPQAEQDVFGHEQSRRAV